MPQYSQPPVLPDWAEGGNALVGAPPPSQQASGFTVNQRPTAQVMNWLFQTVGRSIRWLSQGVNAVMTGASQEPSYRLIGGGMWSFNASSNLLAWSDPFSISMPGLPDSQNVAASGSVSLTAGQVAYVQSNAPFTTTGNVTLGSAQIQNLAYESGIAVGEVVSGVGIPSGATVVSISTTDSSITISAPATANAGGTTLVFASSGPLTVLSANIASFAPSPNTVVIARCYVSTGPNQVHVGVNAGQMLLRDGEAKPLLSNGYVVTQRIKAATAIAPNQTVYLSNSNYEVDSVTYVRYGGQTTTLYLYIDGVNNVTVPANQIGVGDTVTSLGATSTITAVSSNGVITVSPALPVNFEGLSPYPVTPITLNRQNGLLYTTDAQPGVPLQRAKSLGLVPTATAAGAIAHVVQSGTVNGFSSLSAGTPFFLSTGKTQQGQISAAVPTAPGAIYSPVGTAVSSTSVLLNAAAATQAVVLPNGYKAVVDMGYYYNQNSTVAGLQSTQDVLFYSQAIGPQFMVHRYVFTHPGSVVGLSTHLNNSVSPVTTIYLGKATGTLCSINVPSGQLDAYGAFVKNQFSFQAGEPLYAYVYFAGQTGINCALRVYATIEYVTG